MFRAKGSLTPKNVGRPPLPPSNKRQRGGKSVARPISTSEAGSEQREAEADLPPMSPLGTESEATQLTLPEAITRLPSLVAPEPEADPVTGTLYCPECYLPLHPDPEPEKLYIFLHALRYELSLGCFETEMPPWAKEGWVWEQ